VIKVCARCDELMAEIGSSRLTQAPCTLLAPDGRERFIRRQGRRNPAATGEGAGASGEKPVEFPNPGLFFPASGVRFPNGAHAATDAASVAFFFELRFYGVALCSGVSGSASSATGRCNDARECGSPASAAYSA
jgi:hypothetical protein